MQKVQKVNVKMLVHVEMSAGGNLSNLGCYPYFLIINWLFMGMFWRSLHSYLKHGSLHFLKFDCELLIWENEPVHL